MSETNLNKTQETPNTRTFYRRLIPGLALGFLVFIILTLVGDLQQVIANVRAFRWELYPLVLILTLWNYLLRFGKWQYFLKKIGVQNFPTRESARLFVAGFPLAMTPGKVGETLKGVWLHQLTGVPAARGVSAVVAERVSDGLALLVLSAAGVIAYRNYWPAFATVLAIMLSVVVISQIRPLALAILRVGERLPLVNRFAHLLHEFYEGSYALFRPVSTLIAAGLGTISWFAEGVGMYIILIGLGVAPGTSTLTIAIFVLAFSTVIGAVTALPGGLLATDASIVGMLVLLLGMDANTATAATLLIRLATLWFGVGLGMIAWAFSPDLLKLKDGG